MGCHLNEVPHPMIATATTKNVTTHANSVAVRLFVADWAISLFVILC